MRLLFCRGHSFLATLTRFFTWGPYAHVAIDTGEGTVIESLPFKGVIETLTSKWVAANDFHALHIFVSDGEHKDIVTFLRAQVGKPYDYLGVFRFIPRVGKTIATDKVSRWFCSEVIFAAFDLAGIQLLCRVNINKVDPSKLSYSPFLYETDTSYSR